MDSQRVGLAVMLLNTLLLSEVAEMGDSRVGFQGDCPSHRRATHSTVYLAVKE
jgi:hypothetical protein